MLVTDIDTWKRIIRNGEGLIYNDFGTKFPGNSPTWNTRDFNKLHHTYCPRVKKMTITTEGKLTKHFFQSKKEALDWFEANRKEQGYTLCRYCKP